MGIPNKSTYKVIIGGIVNILITGYGRHGKDYICERLRDRYGYMFTSSSWFMANEFIFNNMKESHGYKTVHECFDDRHTDKNRSIWYQMICDYNKDDGARLAKKIFEENDIYCGMRNIDEFNACKEQGVFDVTFWVDAEERIGITEDKTSMTIKKEDCDIVIDNNGAIEEIEKIVGRLHCHFQKIKLQEYLEFGMN